MGRPGGRAASRPVPASRARQTNPAIDPGPIVATRGPIVMGPLRRFPHAPALPKMRRARDAGPGPRHEHPPRQHPDPPVTLHRPVDGGGAGVRHAERHQRRPAAHQLALLGPGPLVADPVVHVGGAGPDGVPSRRTFPDARHRAPARAGRAGGGQPVRHVRCDDAGRTGLHPVRAQRVCPAAGVLPGAALRHRPVDLLDVVRDPAGPAFPR
ncbi:hypothetical protein D3C71_1194630 [compost metagenome]